MTSDEPVLTGQRVALRGVEREDLAQLLEWRNRPDFRRYFREHRELTMSDQTAWYEQVVLKDPGTKMFSIADSEGLRLLGAAGLCYIDWVNRTCDLSIYIGAHDLYIDGEYAPDAAHLLLEYGFGTLDLHRVWVEIYDFDDRKVHLFESLGFALEGRHREHHYDEHGRHDSLFYGLLRHEYDAR
jgi:RimJ/RimL family protein N-acetyltransferase